MRREPTSLHHAGAIAAPACDAFCAVVKSVDAAGIVIETPEGASTARVAASCLLRPEPADRVAYVRVPAHTVYIVAVLERHGPARPVFVLPPGARLTAPDAEIAIEATRLVVQAQRFEVDAGDVRVQAATIRCVGESVDFVVGAVRSVGRKLTTVFDRVFGHARESTREVEGMDVQRARHVDIKAEQLLNLQGDNVLTSGTNLVKTRGAQIHFG